MCVVLIGRALTLQKILLVGITKTLNRKVVLLLYLGGIPAA